MAPSAPTGDHAARVAAPASWRAIDFISDLHLTDRTPRTFEAWSGFMRSTPADAICILGDLFEAWVGDDARFSGFEADVTAVLAAASSRRTVWFMVGNRDFLVGGDMLAASGLQALADPTALTAFGRTALLAHGDAMCIDDGAYQQYRRVVRSAAWQRDVLAKPLAARRAAARAMRNESERQRDDETAGMLHDVDAATAVATMRRAGAELLIHGHTHRPGDEPLAPGLVRHVLTDWDLDDPVRPRAEVLRWSVDGIRRLAPADALASLR